MSLSSDRLLKLGRFVLISANVLMLAATGDWVDSLASAQAKDAFVDKLLFTQFADKAEILKRPNPTGIPKPTLERQLNSLA